jgi:glycosyltransferase involved in cell wall biosynthesis
VDGYTDAATMQIFRVSDPTLRSVFFARMFAWKRRGVLGVLDWTGFQSRHESMIRLLELADDSYGLPEFGPLTISTGDQPTSLNPDCITLGLCRASGFEEIAIPDFVFDRWPEIGIPDYAETTWEVAHAGADEPLQRRCGWIGNAHGNEYRSRLIELSQARPDLLDASGIDWGTNDRIRSPINAAETMPYNYLTLPQQVRRWSTLIDVEGVGYSGRLKILLHSGRPVVIQDRPWHEWFWDGLRPMENFIPVSRDLSDLTAQLAWVRDNPEAAAEIGRAGQQFAIDRLSREAALIELVATIRRISCEQSDASYVPADQRPVLDPVLEHLGAFA